MTSKIEEIRSQSGCHLQKLWNVYNTTLPVPKSIPLCFWFLNWGIPQVSAWKVLWSFFLNQHTNLIILLDLPHFEECKNQRERKRRQEKLAYRNKIFLGWQHKNFYTMQIRWYSDKLQMYHKKTWGQERCFECF